MRRIIGTLLTILVVWEIRVSSTDMEGPEVIERVIKKLNVTNHSSMSPGRRWFYRSAEECLDALGAAAYGPADGNLYCNGTWDKVLCWPATLAGTTTSLPCPPLRGLDQTKYGYKKCSDDGHWEGRVPGDYSLPQGWTNYTGCYTEEALKMYNDLFGKASPQELKDLAHGARIMEMTGLSLSFVSLAVSVFIFCYFRTLRCDRTRIHLNLFVAILIHVTITLVLHTDNFITVHEGEVLGVAADNSGTIFNTDGVCELLTALMEYTKTVMFMWMFVEGMYLHNMLVVSVFSRRPNYILYYIIGWGSPVILTFAWATANELLNKGKCWFAYTYKTYYWILEGPRATVIGVNLIFLLNIIRVLVTKLQQSNSTEAVLVRKAVKAAIVLLPLLGVCNFIVAVNIKKINNKLSFGIFIYVSYFLISFQGFFIALIYCFLNGEVQNTLRSSWGRYRLSRTGSFSSRRRLSRTLSIFTSVTEVPTNQTRWQQPPQPIAPANGRPEYYPCVTEDAPRYDPNVVNGYNPNVNSTLLQQEPVVKNTTVDSSLL